MTAARLGFAYGAQRIFPVGLGVFMTSHHLSEVALTNGFIFLSVSMSLFRSLGLWVRGRARLAQAGTVVAQGSVVGAGRVTGGGR